MLQKASTSLRLRKKRATVEAERLPTANYDPLGRSASHRVRPLLEHHRNGSRPCDQFFVLAYAGLAVQGSTIAQTNLGGLRSRHDARADLDALLRPGPGSDPDCNCNVARSRARSSAAAYSYRRRGNTHARRRLRRTGDLDKIAKPHPLRWAAATGFWRRRHRVRLERFSAIRRCRARLARSIHSGKSLRPVTQGAMI